MKENLQNTWNGVIESGQNYWQEFIRLLPRIGLAVIVFAITVIIAIQAGKLLKNRLTAKARDPLFGRFLANLIKYILLAGCVILFLDLLGLSGIAGGLLAGAGISALVFGFAFKDIAENFLAGIILSFDRPFFLNDTIRIGDQIGHVKELNFRTTHLRTFDEKDVFIPNSKIVKEDVINMTRNGIIRLEFVVGIAYEDDISSAIDCILKAVKDTPNLLEANDPFAVAEELAVSTVNIRVFFWTETHDYKKGAWITTSDVIKNVKEALTQKGFTMPANIQELKLYDKRNSIPLKIVSENSDSKIV